MSLIFTETTLRLRAKCPSFGNRVGSIPEFTQATDPNSALAVPYCFVIPLDDVGELPESNGTYQKINTRFSTLLCLDHSKFKKQSGDGKKYFYSVDDINILRKEIFNALLDWKPITPMSALKVTYDAGEFINMEESRLWYQFSWNLSYFVDHTNTVDPDDLIEQLFEAYVPEGADGSVLPEDYWEAFDYRDPDNYLPE